MFLTGFLQKNTVDRYQLYISENAVILLNVSTKKYLELTVGYSIFSFEISASIIFSLLLVMHSNFKLGGLDSIFNANSIFSTLLVAVFLQKNGRFNVRWTVQPIQKPT